MCRRITPEVSETLVQVRREVAVGILQRMQMHVVGVCNCAEALDLALASHTLDAEIAERLRYFAFRERISESAVIEYSLRDFLDSDEEIHLGQRLRDAGAALRRKS